DDLAHGSGATFGAHFAAVAAAGSHVDHHLVGTGRLGLLATLATVEQALEESGFLHLGLGKLQGIAVRDVVMAEHLPQVTVFQYPADALVGAVDRVLEHEAIADLPALGGRRPGSAVRLVRTRWWHDQGCRG